MQLRFLLCKLGESDDNNLDVIGLQWKGRSDLSFLLPLTHANTCTYTDRRTHIYTYIHAADVSLLELVMVSESWLTSYHIPSPSAQHREAAPTPHVK